MNSVLKLLNDPRGSGDFSCYKELFYWLSMGISWLKTLKAKSMAVTGWS
jgi:hypothetical protein